SPSAQNAKYSLFAFMFAAARRGRHFRVGQRTPHAPLAIFLFQDRQMVAAKGFAGWAGNGIAGDIVGGILGQDDLDHVDCHVPEAGAAHALIMPFDGGPSFEYPSEWAVVDDIFAEELCQGADFTLVETRLILREAVSNGLGVSRFGQNQSRQQRGERETDDDREKSSFCRVHVHGSSFFVWLAPSSLSLRLSHGKS